MNNKHWKNIGNAHKLYFCPYNDLRDVATMYLDDDGEYVFDSELLGTHREWLFLKGLDEAKKEVEFRIAEHYRDQRDYYSELLEKFEEV